MLYIPGGPTVYRILGIDPGTNTLGIAIVDLDLTTRIPSITMATTLNAGKEVTSYPQMIDVHGERRAKLYSHHLNLRYILQQYKPNAVISESPYMGRFAAAFEALVECLFMIRDTILEYDPSMPLETIDPPNAKKAVGASGRGGDKDAVRKAVLALPGLMNNTGSSLSLLDEHAIDAIAVACYKLQTCSVNFR